MAARRMAVVLSVMGWVLLASSTPCHAGSAGLGVRPPTPEEQAYVEAMQIAVSAVAPNDVARARAAAERETMDAVSASTRVAATLPLAADNSTLAWFPPIGNQGGQNSCVAWAAGYYYTTYTQAMDEGINVSGGDPTHVCSPGFLYPLLNGGVDNGASPPYAMARLSVVGCSSLALKPYDERDYTSWPSEAAWVEALSRRTEGLYVIDPGSLEGLEAVKQLLANGQLGIIALEVYANFRYDYPRSAPGIDSGVYYCPAGPYVGGHAVTLVAYDDGRAYRDHRDGLMHYGAFLAANSWGPSWGVENAAGSKGFVWLAYDAFLDGTISSGVLYTGDRDDYRPAMYALVGVEHAQRGYLGLWGGAGCPTTPEGVTGAALYRSGGTELPVNASERIAIDMTDLAELLPGNRIAEVFVKVYVDADAAAGGVIGSAEFRADLDGDGSFEAAWPRDVPAAVAAGSAGTAFIPLFWDVACDNWAHDEIEACVDAGIAGGYPEGTYHPELAVTRDQMAVYVARALAGADDAVPAGPAEPTFPDVPTDYWAFRHVEYAAVRSIVRGYADGSYGPQIPLDRGQMAVFVARAIVDPTGDEGLADYAPPVAATFPDVPSDFWAYEHIEYIADPARAIAQGYPDGRYHPGYVCTRDQMAVYVARAFELTM